MAEPGSPAADDFFRIGHMGHVNAHMVLGMLGAVDAGLKALGLPHGSGALAAATDVVAQATAGATAGAPASAAAAAAR
jgi:alanine-glyoxylate transaminase/serine-glyoxylate transaminase/serine-pyruvate transaminase